MVKHSACSHAVVGLKPGIVNFHCGNYLYVINCVCVPIYGVDDFESKSVWHKKKELTGHLQMPYVLGKKG